jgi:hypothetical protein
MVQVYFQCGLNKCFKIGPLGPSGGLVCHVVALPSDGKPWYLKTPDGGPTLATNVNVKWSVGADIYAADVPSAVSIPKERTEAHLADIVTMDYYGSQKNWVNQVMTSSKSAYSDALIVKKTVAAKVTKIIGSLGGDLAPLAASGDTVVNESFQPHFFQFAANRVHTMASTDFGVVDARVIVEGEMTVFGIAVQDVQGDTLAKKHEVLNTMAMRELVSLAQKDGFIAKLGPYQGLVTPGGFCLIFVNNTDKATHGIRWLLPGSERTMKSAIAFMEAAMESSLAGASTQQVLDFLTKKVATLAAVA